MKRDFFAFVETKSSETSFWGEDFFPGSPVTLDPVADSGFVFGFFVFGTEALEEGLVDRELVGAEAIGGEGSGGGEEKWGFGREERKRTWMMMMVGFGSRV